MSRSLYDVATHRDGAVLWSGRETKPAAIERLKKDMDLELGRTLQMRSCVLEPSRMGKPGNFHNGGNYGSGWKQGGSDTTHVHHDIWGVQKDGTFDVVTRGLTTGEMVSVIGSPAFEVHATKDLKFYFRGSIDDVSECDLFIGMVHDDTIGGGDPVETWPHVHVLANGNFTGTDGIGFWRPEAAAGTDVTFNVWDNNSTTNSTETITFPGDIDDGVEFEFGFHVHGTTSITVYMKVGGLETVQLITRVASATLDLLTTSLLRMAPCVALRAATTPTESITIAGLACTQPL